MRWCNKPKVAAFFRAFLMFVCLVGAVFPFSPAMGQQGVQTGAKQEVDTAQIRELLNLLDQQIEIFDEKLAAMEERADKTQDARIRATLEVQVLELTSALDELEAQKTTLEKFLAALIKAEGGQQSGGGGQ